MSRSTLALAYQAKLGKPAARQDECRRIDAPAALPGATAAVQAARAEPQRETAEDILLIAIRRSLASCRDSSQLRMLAAFESRR